MDPVNLCPVCGYSLDQPAWNGLSPSDEICLSCGIQFGYTDHAGGDPTERKRLYARWREAWIARGMPWNSPGEAPPENWDPQEQLRRINAGE
jgi:hypothetical protein